MPGHAARPAAPDHTSAKRPRALSRTFRPNQADPGPVLGPASATSKPECAKVHRQGRIPRNLVVVPKYGPPAWAGSAMLLTARGRCSGAVEVHWSKMFRPFDSETLQPCKQPGCASKTRFPQAFMGLDQGGEKTRRQSCSVRPPAPGCVRGLQPGLSTAVCPRFRGFAVVGLSLPCPPCHGGMRDGTNRIPTGAAPDRKRSGDGALGMKLVCLGPVSPCDPAGQGRSRALSMSLVTGIKAV